MENSFNFFHRYSGAVCDKYSWRLLDLFPFCSLIWLNSLKGVFICDVVKWEVISLGILSCEVATCKLKPNTYCFHYQVG